MTEAEWLACTDEKRALHFLEDTQPNERKFRLFAVACCRRIEDAILRVNGAFQAVGVAEKVVEHGMAQVIYEEIQQLARKRLELESLWVDGGFIEKERRIKWHAGQAAYGCLSGYEDNNAGWAWDYPSLMIVGDHAATAAAHSGRCDEDGLDELYEYRKHAESSEQCKRLRDIFGNPFRPVTLDPSWFPPTATMLGRVD